MVLKLQDTLDNESRIGDSMKLTLLEFLQTHDDRCSRLLNKLRDVHFAAVTTTNVKVVMSCPRDKSGPCGLIFV